MNKMAEVAKILGVQLSEEFDIEESDLNPFKIIKRGIIDREGYFRHLILLDIIKGDIKIVKRPFKPVRGENHWFASSNGKACCTINGHANIDYHRISSGNCFRTAEEAEAAAPEIVKKIQAFFAEV